MIGQHEWFCPLLDRLIDEGSCLEINYERLKSIQVGILDTVTQECGKNEPEISRTCESCPNQPLKGEAEK